MEFTKRRVGRTSDRREHTRSAGQSPGVEQPQGVGVFCAYEANETNETDTAHETDAAHETYEADASNDTNGRVVRRYIQSGVPLRTRTVSPHSLICCFLEFLHCPRITEL